MVWSLNALSLVAALAAAPAARSPAAGPTDTPISASAATAPAAPHFVVGLDTGRQASLVDLASRAEAGKALTYDVRVLRKAPLHVGDAEIYWGDGQLQADCASHRLRITVSAGWTLGRDRKIDLKPAQTRAFASGLSAARGRALARFVCRGTGAAGFPDAPDLPGFAQTYLGPKAGAARAANDRVAEALKAPFYAVDTDEAGALLVQTQGARRTGDVVSVTVYALTTHPLPEDRNAYWIKSEAEVDCAGHRMRDATLELLDLDLAARKTREDPKLGDWYANPPGAVGARIEGWVCLGRRDEGVIPVESLKAFQGALFSSTARK